MVRTTVKGESVARACSASLRPPLASAGGWSPRDSAAMVSRTLASQRLAPAMAATRAGAVGTPPASAASMSARWGSTPSRRRRAMRARCLPRASTNRRREARSSTSCAYASAWSRAFSVRETSAREIASAVRGSISVEGRGEGSRTPAGRVPSEAVPPSRARAPGLARRRSPSLGGSRPRATDRQARLAAPAPPSSPRRARRPDRPRPRKTPASGA